MDLVSLSYQNPEHAKNYAKKHDRSLGKRLADLREQRVVARAIRRIRSRTDCATVLDLPSGTGRFLPLLAREGLRATAMDASAAMLHEGRPMHDLFSRPPRVAVGSALEIPLRDGAVDLVLCSRLIHHVCDPGQRDQLLRELARVARCGVVVTFFDAHSFFAWKRLRKERRTGRRSKRYPIPRGELVRSARAAGLELIGMNAVLRFHSEITAAAFTRPSCPVGAAS
ncbi:MAG: class I SAM-dependent methyltransferase [Planctomycetota bacterium]